MAKQQDITDILSEPINPERVSYKPGGGGSTLAYLEGRDVIDTANEVFGYDGWSHEVVRLEQLKVDRGVAYLAVVRVTVKVAGATWAPATREDCNVGESRLKFMSDAHQVASTAAVTGALKRALRTFGNQFGNSLYDKEESWQTDFYITAQDKRDFWLATLGKTDLPSEDVKAIFDSSMKELGVTDSNKVPKNKWDDFKEKVQIGVAAKGLKEKKPKANGKRKPKQSAKKEQPHVD